MSIRYTSRLEVNASPLAPPGAKIGTALGVGLGSRVGEAVREGVGEGGRWVAVGRNGWVEEAVGGMTGGTDGEKKAAHMPSSKMTSTAPAVIFQTFLLDLEGGGDAGGA
jgi:hypothetical protein